MSSCKFTSTTTPRVLPQRHEDGCRDDSCAGCAPCPLPHCRVDGRTHVERAQQACAECVGEARANLHEIARLCDALPEEVEHRGVEGEAMMLLGPVSDPEAWGHVTASVAAGRLSREWVEDGGGELHPLTVLLSWQMVWRDALDHDEAKDAELATAVAYLDGSLSYLAGYEWVPFEDFAKDLRRCVGHLEAVLHDGEQVDRTRVPCVECGALLERRFAKDAKDDHHTCPRCKRTYDGGDFSIAKAAHLSSEPADRFVAISDAAQAVERSQFTIRTWVNREVVKSTRSSTGRLLVWWPDVRDENRRRKFRNLARETA